MAITAKSKVQFRLAATTVLSPSDALNIIRQSATTVKKGGGVNAMNFNLLNMKAQVNVERESADRLALSITSFDRRVELCTFSARVSSSNSDGKTRLQIGGLETYKTTQQKMFIFIPVGPKSIWGYPLYRHFLDVVASALSQSDPSAQVSVETPSAT